MNAVIETVSRNRFSTESSLEFNPFLVIQLIGVGLLSALDAPLSHILLYLGSANLILGAASLIASPIRSLRSMVRLATRIRYRVRTSRLDRIPSRGPAVLVANHVSYIDGLIIAASVARPVRFVVWAPIYHNPWLNWIFRMAGAVPIDSGRRNRKQLLTAFERIDAYLKAGELVCIFPEGALTRDGLVGPFKSGIERILRKNPVPVVPLGLRGLWGSRFSHGRLRRGFWFRKIDLTAGPAIPPHAVRADTLRNAVMGLCR